MPSARWNFCSKPRSRGTFSSSIGQAYLAAGRAQEANGRREPAPSSFRSAAEHLEKALGQDPPDARAARGLLTMR